MDPLDEFEQPPMPRNKCGIGIWANNIVILVGGNDRGTSMCSSKVDIFDQEPQFGSSPWSSLPPLNHARSECAVAILNNALYVIGGRNDKRESLAVCEVLDLTDPTTAGFRILPNDLPRSLWSAVTASTGSSIYVVGGSSSDIVDTVQVLDTENNTWTTLPTMQQRRLLPAVTIWGDYLVVAGGSYRENDDAIGVHRVIASVETFHIPSGQWTNIIPDMPYPCCAAVAFCEQKNQEGSHSNLIIAGGVTSNDAAVSSFSRYQMNDEDGIWIEVSPIPTMDNHSFSNLSVICNISCESLLYVDLESNFKELSLENMASSPSGIPLVFGRSPPYILPAKAIIGEESEADSATKKRPPDAEVKNTADTASDSLKKLKVTETAADVAPDDMETKPEFAAPSIRTVTIDINKRQKTDPDAFQPQRPPLLHKGEMNDADYVMIIAFAHRIQMEGEISCLRRLCQRGVVIRENESGQVFYSISQDLRRTVLNCALNQILTELNKFDCLEESTWIGVLPSISKVQWLLNRSDGGLEQEQKVTISKIFQITGDVHYFTNGDAGAARAYYARAIDSLYCMVMEIFATNDISKHDNNDDRFIQVLTKSGVCGQIIPLVHLLKRPNDEAKSAVALDLLGSFLLTSNCPIMTQFKHGMKTFYKGYGDPRLLPKESKDVSKLVELMDQILYEPQGLEPTQFKRLDLKIWAPQKDITALSLALFGLGLSSHRAAAYERALSCLEVALVLVRQQLQ